jgi:S-methyl-5-thioribose kinase
VGVRSTDGTTIKTLTGAGTTTTTVIHADGTTMSISTVDQDGPAQPAAGMTDAAVLREQMNCAVAGAPVVLTPATVVGYVEQLNLAVFAGSSSEGRPLQASDSSTGNLNYCFVVKAAAAGEPCPPSVFVKQAPDFVRCLGEDAKLTTERIKIEATAALEFCARAPGSTPLLYHFDASNCVLTMEHLSDHTLLQDALSTGDITDKPALAVARFMAAVHGSTLGSAELARRFVNKALCGITDQYVFTLPFQQDESNSNDPALDERAAALRASEPLQQAITHARKRFGSVKEGLIHGDLHSGSVMTDGSDGKVIDHEFAFFGPVGFDLGLFLAGYTFPYAVRAPELKKELLAQAVSQALKQPTVLPIVGGTRFIPRKQARRARPRDARVCAVVLRAAGAQCGGGCQHGGGEHRIDMDGRTALHGVRRHGRRALHIIYIDIRVRGEIMGLIIIRTA